jgi:hypothetical protein
LAKKTADLLGVWTGMTVLGLYRIEILSATEIIINGRAMKYKAARQTLTLIDGNLSFTLRYAVSGNDLGAALILLYPDGTQVAFTRTEHVSVSVGRKTAGSGKAAAREQAAPNLRSARKFMRGSYISYSQSTGPISNTSGTTRLVFQSDGTFTVDSETSFNAKILNSNFQYDTAYAFAKTPGGGSYKINGAMLYLTFDGLETSVAEIVAVDDDGLVREFMIGTKRYWAE